MASEVVIAWLRMGIRRDIRLFRDSRFLRFLRAIPEVHVIRLTVTRWPSLAFGIMSLIFHAFECGTNAPGIRGHEAPGIEWCSILAQWDGWVRMEPSLASFTSHRRALSWPRGAVTFSPHSALAVCASHALLSACRAWPATSRRLGREGLCSSFTLRVGRP